MIKIESSRDKEKLAFIKRFSPLKIEKVEALLGDAGSRQYSRLTSGRKTFILLEQNPATGSIAPFIKINNLLEVCKIPVGKVYSANIQEGFALLEDLGDETLYPLTQSNPEEALQEALQVLVAWQKKSLEISASFPIYDQNARRKETNLFLTWFLPFVDEKLNSGEENKLFQELEALNQESGANNEVLVHRDYHCRNIMRTAKGLILLDYQDAIYGCPSYDLTSLTRDCYCDYQPELIQKLEDNFLQTIDYKEISLSEWRRRCEINALQRHLKVLGIFVRLAKRDGKNNYLQYLPRVLNYARQESASFPTLHEILKRITLKLEN